MQTPQGHEVINGVVVPVDWFAVIFNPSFPYRLLHMTTAAFLASAFFIAASAAAPVAQQQIRCHEKMFSMSLWLIVVLAPLRALIGDAHGLNTLKHQPVKVAAMEGHWENKPGRPHR